MGNVGASSKPLDPLQEPSKPSFQPQPTTISMAAAADDQSKSKQLPNPGTMDEINKRTKGKQTLSIIKQHFVVNYLIKKLIFVSRLEKRVFFSQTMHSI